MSKSVFLDTNIFLHYRDLDQIDWLTVLETDSVTIIIPPITVQELQSKKDSLSRTRIRKRAEMALKKFYALYETDQQAQPHTNINIQLEARDPLIDFSANQLSRDVQDDHLIASMLSYRNEHPEMDIVLVTSDVGLTLLAKAKIQGIKTIRLPDSFKLDEEPDPDQEKIKELEQEIRNIKLKMPQLNLVFGDDKQFATFTLPAPVIVTQESIDKKISKVKAQHPHMAPKKIDLSKAKNMTDALMTMAAAMSAMESLNSISTEDITKYNEELEEYYKSYAQYLRTEADFQNLQHRAIQLSIWLANDGTAPAEDIDVYLHFPDGFDLFNKDDRPEPPTPPKPPTPPRTQMQKLFDGTSLHESVYPIFNRYHEPAPIYQQPNVSSPIIKRTSSYDVKFHVEGIKHHLKEPSEVLYVIFESYETARSFHISYEILAADLPHKVTGNLHIIIKKEPPGQPN
jgi:predicted nucleic acid-binding protein